MTHQRMPEVAQAIGATVLDTLISRAMPMAGREAKLLQLDREDVALAVVTSLIRKLDSGALDSNAVNTMMRELYGD